MPEKETTDPDPQPGMSEKRHANREALAAILLGPLPLAILFGLEFRVGDRHLVVQQVRTEHTRWV